MENPKRLLNLVVIVVILLPHGQKTVRCELHFEEILDMSSQDYACASQLVPSFTGAVEVGSHLHCG